MINLDDINELKDIFMSDIEYNELGGDNLYNDFCFDNLSENGNSFKVWESLSETNKDKYIYTLVKNISNKEDTHQSFNLLRAILLARHASIKVLEEFTKDVYSSSIDKSTLEKKYRLLLIDKIMQRMSDDTKYCKSHQIINVNPYMHSKEYYKQLIDDIFDDKKHAFPMKDTSIFRTIGDRIAFTLFLDDMINNNQPRTKIANSTGMDLKQITREKKFLDYYINIFQN